MTKGQLVKIKKDAQTTVFAKAGPDTSGAFVILKGPYEGIFTKNNYSQLSQVVDLLTPSGDVWEKIGCEYLERI